MAIPNNYIDKITNKDTGESRIISPAADKVRVDNENFEGADLEEVLDEVAQAIENAGSGDGTVTGVKVGSTTYEPTEGVVDLSTPFGAKVDKNGTDSLMSAAEHTKLAGIAAGAQVNVISGIKANGASETLPVENGIVTLPPAGSTISPATASPLEDGTAGVGSSEKYAREDHVHPHDSTKANASDVYSKTQTYNKDELNAMLDDIEAGDTIVVNSDGANIVDEHDNNSVLLAPSARQMKLMYNNIMALYNNLANTAFTNGKPTLDWAGSKTKYTLSYGTLTGCTADVAAGQVNEGALRIKLTPTQASYAFTSVTVNGESASTTATGDADGSVYLDIVVNGNITVAATAISGRGITFNGTGCSIGAAGVAIGQDLDTTITANEHFTLPASITVKIGNTNVTHTYTRAQDNKTATLHIDAANITGDLAITCTADEGAHAVLDLTNVGSGVTVNKANNAHVYVGDTITIMPASGNKVTASATVGGNAATLTGDTYAGYSYTIGSGDVSSSGTTIAITATADALDTFSIDLTGVTSDVGVTWNTPSAAVSTILEGSPFSVTLAKVSGTGVLNISTSTMGSVTLSPNNGTIATDHVTGNITIAASVAAAQQKVHSYDRTHIEGTEEEPPRHFVDQVGNFDLYLQADANYNTNYYAAGYYANGKNDGYRHGYGNRDLSIASGADFTLAFKGVAIQRNTGQAASYNSSQLIHKFYDRGAPNIGTSDTVGQFQIQLSSTDDLSGNTTTVMYPHIAYQSASATVKKRFYESGTTGTVAYNDGKTYSVVIAYNSSTKTATAWVVKDSSGTKTLHLCGTLSIPDGLILPCIAIKSSKLLNEGLDVYNYAMTEQQVAAEFNATIS